MSPNTSQNNNRMFLERKGSVHENGKSINTLKNQRNPPSSILHSPSSQFKTIASKGQSKAHPNQTQGYQSNNKADQTKVIHNLHQQNSTLLNHLNKKKQNLNNLKSQLKSIHSETFQKINSLEETVDKFSSEVTRYKAKANAYDKLIKEKELYLIEIENLKKENQIMKSDLDITNLKLNEAEEKNIKLKLQLEENHEMSYNREQNCQRLANDKIESIESKLKRILRNSSEKYVFLKEENIQYMKIDECTEHVSKLLEFLQKELEYQQQKYNQLLELHNESLDNSNSNEQFKKGYASNVSEHYEFKLKPQPVALEEEDRGSIALQQRIMQLENELKQMESNEDQKDSS